MKVKTKSASVDDQTSTTESELQLLVEEVRKRILESKLPLTPKTDFEFIAKFVRIKKYSVEDATKAIQGYYDNVYRLLKRVEGMKPSHYSEIYASNTVAILKHRVNGQRVIHASIGNWDTKEHDIRAIQCAAIFILEELLGETETQLNGGIAICDLRGFGFCHVRQCSLSEIKIAIQTIVSGIPAKIKGIHFLNAPSIFWPVFKVVSKLLPEKIQKRVNFHSNLESLHQHLDKKLLPECLGGELEDDEGLDLEFMEKLLNRNPCYEDYWNGDASRRPRRLSRKRSSMLISTST